VACQLLRSTSRYAHPGRSPPADTRAQILDHVWSYDADNVSNVVDIYVHYLRDKIDRGEPARSSRQCAAWAIKMQA
jgi:DNA-binding response OmpR family regulator